jgi:hypothetical protein
LRCPEVSLALLAFNPTFASEMMLMVNNHLTGLNHQLDGDTNLKNTLLCFLTPNKKISKKKALAFNQDRY